MNENKFPSWAGYLILFLVVAFVANKMLNKAFGETVEEKKAKKMGANYGSPFNPSYFQEAQKKNSVVLLTDKSAYEIANNIKLSDKVFNDDEAAVMREFKKLKYKTQVSYVAKFFADRAKKDLTTFLKSFLDSNELAEIVAYVDSLPTGINAK